MAARERDASERARRFQSLAELPLVPVGAGATKGTGSLAEIFRHREMLSLLIRRDLKSRYKDSSLGFVWTLVRPLTQLAIYYVVMGQFLGASRGIADFAVYVFAGLTIYGLFSEVVLGGVGSVVANAGLVKKIYLPREVFPLAALGGGVFNFGIQFVVLVGATLLVGSPPFGPAVLYAIPSIAIIIVYATALALLLSAINVYLRDTQYLTEVVVMLLMWASPIVYSWSMARNIVGDGLLLSLYTNNPVTLAVLGFHKAMWTAGGPEEYPDQLLVRMIVAILVGLVGLFICHSVFRRLQGNFAQEI